MTARYEEIWRYEMEYPGYDHLLDEDLSEGIWYENVGSFINWIIQSLHGAWHGNFLAMFLLKCYREEASEDINQRPLPDDKVVSLITSSYHFYLSDLRDDVVIVAESQKKVWVIHCDMDSSDCSFGFLSKSERNVEKALSWARHYAEEIASEYQGAEHGSIPLVRSLLDMLPNGVSDLPKGSLKW